MPAGCVQCANGEWQCGSDTSELCAAGGGWTPAGALCLQFFVRKHPKTGNCIIRIQPSFAEECGGNEVMMAGVPLAAVTVVQPPKKKSKKRK